MNVDRIRHMIDDVRRWISSGGSEKVKLLGISVVLAVLVTWLGINLVPALWPESAARPLDTPGWNLVQELNAALLTKQAFMDTGFVVESEDPLKLKLVGVVETEEDLDDLGAFVAKLRPQKDYVMAVQLLDEITNVSEPDGAATDDSADEGGEGAK